MRIHLGGGAYADVLYPDRDVSRVESNTGSVILRVVYGKTEFLLTGDAPASIEDWLVAQYGSALQSDVLKAGHHGSRTSSSVRFVEAVAPKLVVISAGADNSYGHPHQEVTGRVLAAGAALASTAESSTLTYASDGENIRKY
jgi:competence protein ComEC